MKQQDIIEAREQTQEDIISFIESYNFISHPEFLKDNICDIIVENFNDLGDKYFEMKCAENRREIKKN
jgi:hypothetical protein